MNQSVLFNDDLSFDQQHDCWSMTALIAGQSINVYFHSFQLKQLTEISSCTQYDLEEAVELWLEKNELEGKEIHLDFK